MTHLAYTQWEHLREQGMGMSCGLSATKHNKNPRKASRRTIQKIQNLSCHKNQKGVGTSTKTVEGSSQGN
eukprot:10283138-Ditylum_brightwellii.AAC.1